MPNLQTAAGHSLGKRPAPKRLSDIYRRGPAALIHALPFVEPRLSPAARAFARLFLLQLADYQHMIAQESDRSQVLGQIIRDAIAAIKDGSMTPDLNKTLTRKLKAIWHGSARRNRCIQSARRLAIRALDTCPVADALMMLEADSADGIAPSESHLHAIVGIALANAGGCLFDAEALLP